MKPKDRKYIDTHWLIFAIQGAITLIFGWYVLFSGNTDSYYLASLLGVMLLILGLIELFNVLHRQHLRKSWGFTFLAAIFELVAALALLFTANQNPAWALGILAIYTMVRGICELLIALKSIDDSTDKFIWLICGICGVITAFVVLNSGSLPSDMFIRFFGSYLLILGVADLIYGVHNREQKQDAIAAKAAKTTKKTTKAKASKKRK